MQTRQMKEEAVGVKPGESATATGQGMLTVVTIHLPTETMDLPLNTPLNVCIPNQCPRETGS
jgi:hypothetical protein